MSKKIYDIEENNMAALVGYTPYFSSFPNGKPMFGIQFNYIHLPITDLVKESDKETLYFFFLKKSWPFRIGFQLIWYGFLNLFRKTDIS